MADERDDTRLSTVEDLLDDIADEEAVFDRLWSESAAPEPAG